MPHATLEAQAVDRRIRGLRSCLFASFPAHAELRLALRRPFFGQAEANAPLRRSVTLEQLGGAALYLLSDLSGGVTGEIHHVDSGYNIVGLPYISGTSVRD